MKRPRSGSTIKQVAYATRTLGGQASSKKEAALLSGFSRSVANNAKNKIESTEGYKNAMIGLAVESNNLLLAIMSEFKARGVQNFSDADLIKALNAVTGAWDKIDTKRAPDKLRTPEGNRLHAVFRREVQTVIVSPDPLPTEDSASASEPIHTEATVIEPKALPNPDMDF